MHHSSQYPHFLLFPRHHLYADDTQLFLSFLPTHFDASLDRISSWMTANFITLNFSKTEFLLIGLSKQLVKINNSSLTPLTLLETSAFIFDEHLTFLTRFHLSPNLTITIFVSFAVSVYTSIPKQLPPSPLSLFTASLTTATLFIITCPNLRSPDSNRYRTLLLVVLSKLQNPVTSLP